MRIHSLQLKNFKRFTDLELREIPETAKLVLLIGANGSGKSSVFDAFEYISRPAKALPRAQHESYFAKGDRREEVIVDFGSTKVSLDRPLQLPVTFPPVAPPPTDQLLVKMYGRSALRDMARVPPWQGSAVNDFISRDADSPASFIDVDARLSADVSKYVVDFNHALRQPVFDGRQVDIAQIADAFVTPLNSALERVFGTTGPFPKMLNFREAESGRDAPKFIFKKGAHEFGYDLLSLGEKQVFSVLLNLFVRKEKLQNAIIYIDELDLHLNTALQYALLEEIVECWIPETSQLWTASHSLGFIRYASQSDNAVIFDFDALDFDLPQALMPVPKESSEVLQVAVPREYLGALFAGKRLIYCEGNDVSYFNSIGLKDTIFANGGNKFQIFARARDAQIGALMDRDYLTLEEIAECRVRLPLLRILPLYSIENFLFHPDNLAEVLGAAFDREAYVVALCAEKNLAYDHLNFGIGKARDGYPQARDLPKEDRQKFEERGREVSRLLKSDSFDDFYPLFPMKDCAKQVPQRQNLSRQKLSHTMWFAGQMTALLAGIPLGQGN